MGTDAGFIFSLCAGVLVGLKVWADRFGKKKPDIPKKEEYDPLKDPNVYVLKQEDKDRYAKFCRNYSIEELKNGMLISKNGKLYMYREHEGFFPLKEEGPDRHKILKDLWYGTGGHK